MYQGKVLHAQPQTCSLQLPGTAAADAAGQSMAMTLLMKDCPVVASSSSMTMIATMAMRPFQVSADLVQPQVHTSTGAGRVRRSRS